MPEIDLEWWRSGTFDQQPMSEILCTRDFARTFGFLRGRGWSLAAIAGSTGLTENRIRAICSGKQRVISYEVMERIADGLRIERGLLGLAYTGQQNTGVAGTGIPVAIPSQRREAAQPSADGGCPAKQLLPATHVGTGTAWSVRPEEVLIMNIGDESAQHGRQAGHSNIADNQLDQMESAVDRLCADIIDGPLIPLVRELRQVRDEAFTALEGRQYPRQSRRLYAVGARACGLLAGTAADRFALYNAANNHARTASIAAEFSEDSALAAWTASLHSTIAFWQGRYRSAAIIAQRARKDGLTGVEPARLASLEARAWAKLGDRDAMFAALHAARTARDQDGPQAGVGVIAYPYANQVRVNATALLWIGEYATARTELAQAISLLAEEYDSPAHVAAARMDLADAHLRTDALEEAAAVLHPLIRIPMRTSPEQRAGART